MSKGKDGQARGKYTLEFKLEAVPVTAKILGVPVQTLGNWVRLSEKGQIKGAGDKPVSAEQMELARLRAAPSASCAVCWSPPQHRRHHRYARRIDGKWA